jgi:hypothetical protein
MIFRLSQKLAAKIHERPTAAPPLDENPLADWSGHLFTADRTQYILAFNTACFYSAVFFGRGITDDHQFLRLALPMIREVMDRDGLEFLHRRDVAPSTGAIRFAKPLSRSVIGTMNEFVHEAKFILTHEAISPFDLSFRLNEMPCSVLKYDSPREAIGVLGGAG